MNGGKEPATHQQRAAAGLGHRGDGAVEGDKNDKSDKSAAAKPPPFVPFCDPPDYEHPVC